MRSTEQQSSKGNRLDPCFAIALCFAISTGSSALTLESVEAVKRFNRNRNQVKKYPLHDAVNAALTGTIKNGFRRYHSTPIQAEGVKASKHIRQGFMSLATLQSIVGHCSHGLKVSVLFCDLCRVSRTLNG